MRRRRIVAIELGMCRSGRIGGASGSVTVGNGRSRELRLGRKRLQRADSHDFHAGTPESELSCSITANVRFSCTCIGDYFGFSTPEWARANSPTVMDRGPGELFDIIVRARHVAVLIIGHCTAQMLDDALGRRLRPGPLLQPRLAGAHRERSSSMRRRSRSSCGAARSAGMSRQRKTDVRLSQARVRSTTHRRGSS